MDRSKCVIAVPLYKPEFDFDEYNSIKQLFKILSPEKYDIVAFCPISLDLTYYIENFKFKEFYEFWEFYFTNYPDGYNSLLLASGFYKCFDRYEYILIYQPDCWVFRDELEYWVNKEYDYIGAPFVYIYPDYLSTKTTIGNGGLSLRKISTFIYLCDKYSELCYKICHSNNKLVGEDHIFIELISSGALNKYNLPSHYEALHFAFEMNPHISYHVIDNKLPFGCHAYKKIIHSEFWEDFIVYGHKRYSVVTFLFGNYDTLKDPLVVDDAAEYICITDRTDLKSNVWKFEKITEYDISNYNDWQKSLIARYTALNHITTNKCIIVDASIEIKQSLTDFVNSTILGNLGVIIHPFRDSYLDELDEWINKRNLDSKQKDDFIDYCNRIGFDYNNLKGFIMTTVMYIKKSNHTVEMMNFILNTLMNNYDFSIRVDQLYFSVIIYKYYSYLVSIFHSYQILNSPYFNYYYHDQKFTHADDYSPNLSEPELRYFCNNPVVCKYLL